MVQQAVVTILNAIYEVDFKGFSYGFPLSTHRASHPSVRFDPCIRGGAVCVSSARTDLCGGRSVMVVPTATGDSFSTTHAPRRISTRRTRVLAPREAHASTCRISTHANAGCFPNDWANPLVGQKACSSLDCHFLGRGHLLLKRIKTVSKRHLNRSLGLSDERRADSPGCWKD